jgi:hypothetical protein
MVVETKRSICDPFRDIKDMFEDLNETCLRRWRSHLGDFHGETCGDSMVTWRSHRDDFHGDMFEDIKISLWRFSWRHI